MHNIFTYPDIRSTGYCTDKYRASLVNFDEMAGYWQKNSQENYLDLILNHWFFHWDFEMLRTNALYQPMEVAEQLLLLP